MNPDEATPTAEAWCTCGAGALNPAEWPFGDLTVQQPDDPAPTTGGPVDFDRAEGCRCYLREDPEWGDLLTAPHGGCPVHSCTCLDYSLGNGHSATCLHTTLNAGAPS